MVSPATDANTTTVQVWVDVPNPGERLKPGTSVHAVIVAEEFKAATVVPAAAILPGEEGGTAVLTVGSDSTVHRKTVKVGVREGNQVQILTGVSPGEEVVVVGGLGLDDKAKVKVVTTRSKKPTTRMRKRAARTQQPDKATQGPEERRGEAEGKMSQLSTLPPVTSDTEAPHWTARHGKPIIFVILTLVAVGIYLALTIPGRRFSRIRIFRASWWASTTASSPSTRCWSRSRSRSKKPSTRCPGLDHLSSITSRGHGGNRPVLYVERGYVPDAGTGERRAGARPADAAVQRQNHRQSPDLRGVPDHGLQPDFGQDPADTLWEMANYDLKPRLNRATGVSSIVVQGGQVPEFQVQPDPAKLIQTGVTIPNILDAIGRSNMIDSPGLIETNHQLVLSLVSGQARSAGDIGNIVVKTTPAGAPMHIGDVATVSAFGDAGLHRRDRQWQARRAAEHLPPAGQQHGGGGQCGSCGDRESQEGSAPRRRSARRSTISRNSSTTPSRACATPSCSAWCWLR